MSVTEIFWGPLPAYDPKLDPLAKPTPEEMAEAPVHVARCAFRYGQLKSDVTELRREIYGQKIFNTMLVLLAVGGSHLLTTLLPLFQVR